MTEYIIKDGVLYHHGIKGQKWGNRRWQNEDGSLTAAGREHYGYGQARSNMVSAKAKYKASRKAYSKAFDRATGAGQYIRALTKKGRAENDRRSAELVKTARDAEKAKTAYKQAKTDYKNSDEYKARQEKIKKAAKIGAAVAGTALVAYGAYKAADFINNKRAINAGKKAYDQIAKDRRMLSDLVEGGKKFRSGPNAAYQQSYKVGGQSYSWTNYRNHPELVPDHLKGANSPLESTRFEGKTAQEGYIDAYNAVRFKKKRIH